jgi:hypothetical protein
MKRIASLVVILLIAMSLFATDRFSREPGQTYVATTGRILKTNARTRTIVVRGSEVLSVHNSPVTNATSWQAIGARLPEILVPGGITISLPGRTVNLPQSKPNSNANLNEYTVVTTRDTVFEDGGDSIRFEDFKNGETISIHGLLKGTTLTASRVAKWD